jgi:hypothetical protein
MLNDNSLYMLSIWQICAVFFIGIIFFAYLGYKTESRTLNRDKDGNGFEPAKTGLITLLSLIIGFTFSMSGQRYQSYKTSMIEEVNCINAAAIKSDLYPEPYRTELRKYFSDYVEARISFYDAGTKIDKLNESKKNSDNAGKKIWALSAKLFDDPKMGNVSRLMVPSLTEMYDAATTREATLRSKVPVWTLLLIVIITFLSVYVTGYGTNSFRRKELIYVLSFAVAIIMVTFIILDLDRPDGGLIKPTVEQDAMIDLRKIFTE